MILVLKNQHNYDINFGDVQDSTFFACEKEISENDVTESEKEALAFTTWFTAFCLLFRMTIYLLELSKEK